MQDFGPFPIGVAGQIRRLELEIRQLKARLSKALIGSNINTAAFTTILPGPGSGSGSMIQNFINDSGANLDDGMVVVLKTSENRKIDTTTGFRDMRVIGVVRGDASPYIDGAETPVLLQGYHPALQVTAPVVDGEYLIASDTAGLAISTEINTGIAPDFGTFAIALLEVPDPGPTTVPAYIFPITPSYGQWRVNDTVTIVGGEITAKGSHLKVDTEGGDPSDDLDTINHMFNDGYEGRLLIIRPTHEDRTIVIKHNIGNILCPGGVDVVLDDLSDWALLLFASGPDAWCVL